MSHLVNLIPWPTLDHLPAGAATYDGEDGMSLPQPGAIEAAEMLVAAHPDGIPLPADFAGEGDYAPHASFCWGQDGRVVLQFDRLTRRGEIGTLDEGGTWGEGFALWIEGEIVDLAATLAALERRPYQSHQTLVEQARDAAFMRRHQLICGWANSPTARSIPWGSMLDGYRRDIADSVDALQQVAHRPGGVAPHPRRGEWIATIVRAVSEYPVARSGLLRLLADTGCLPLLAADGRIVDDTGQACETAPPGAYEPGVGPTAAYPLARTFLDAEGVLRIQPLRLV